MTLDDAGDAQTWFNEEAHYYAMQMVKGLQNLSEPLQTQLKETTDKKRKAQLTWQLTQYKRRIAQAGAVTPANAPGVTGFDYEVTSLGPAYDEPASNPMTEILSRFRQTVHVGALEE